MKKLLYVVAVALLVAGGLVYYGGSYATSMVHDQLAEQKIYFPASQADGLPPSLQMYAGQQVDSGEKAKAYADDYIKEHLQKVAGGKTYAEVSSAYQKDKTNQALAGQRQTLFMGETLRGILLNAWGWGLIGMIALYVSYVLLAAGVVVGLVAVTGFAVPKKKPVAKRKK